MTSCQSDAGTQLGRKSATVMFPQMLVFALVVTWVRYGLASDLLASNYSKVARSGTAYSSASVKIGHNLADVPHNTNISVMIGVEPDSRASTNSFVVYAKSFTEDAENQSSERNLPISEARMTSSNTDFKSALSHLAQDVRYYTRPVYRAQDRNGGPEPLTSVHHSQDSTKRGTDQSPPTANYSHYKAPQISRYTEATQDKASGLNDSDREPLPQDPYSGPDSYHTTPPAPPKSPLPPPTDMLQLQPPKKSPMSNIFKYDPQKSKEPVVQPVDTYRIPPSTDFYKSIVSNYRSPDPKELYTASVENYQLQPPKEIYEPEIDAYQHARPKESMKSPEQIYQPPKPKDSLTLHMGMYQPPNLKYYYKPPIDSHEPPLAKEPHKPPLVLSPEFYKSSMEATKPSKDPHDVPPSADSLIHHSSPSEDVNDHRPQEPSYTAHLQDDVYVDYDPSSHSHKEKLHEHDHPHDHDHSQEYVYSHHEPPAPPKNSYGAPPPPSKDTYGPPSSPSRQPYGTPPPPSKDIYGAPPPPKDIYRDRPPPPKGSYAVPPPPPKETYGAPLPPPPPPKDSYGAPPPPPKDSYGAPPPPPKDSYGAPPPPKEPYMYDASPYHHAYGAPPAPPMAPPPPPPPKRKRFGYYQIGRKLYLIPAYFTALFIPYVLALIIKSVLKRKVRAPFNYWAATQSRELGPDVTAERVARVARALQAAGRRYK
ncbi:extensin-3-like [Cryptotermes secundus]|uniref:extensin-3-like n=1 Tax=Cryptotermes secundus TaxID=105785 RepID=UPI001454CC5E|nr:extensin-3-like [Cryptotermes secundus]